MIETIEQKTKPYLKNARACGDAYARNLICQYIERILLEKDTPEETRINEIRRRINISLGYYSGFFLGLFLGAKPEEFKRERRQEIN